MDEIIVCTLMVSYDLFIDNQNSNFTVSQLILSSSQEISKFSFTVIVVNQTLISYYFNRKLIVVYLFSLRGS